MNPDLVQALQQEFQLSAKDIADIFWLASHIDQCSESVTPANEPSPSPSAEPGSDSSSSSQTTPESPPQPVSQADNPKNPPENSPEDKPVSSPTPQPPQAEIVPKPEPSQTAPGGGGLPIRLSDAPSLREPLTLARALKPLMRRVSGGRDWVIDEVATSEQIASQGIWIPVLRPRLEPWLDLDLVVEDCLSMLLWRHTLRDLEKLLKNYGIFRDVRVWSLLTDNPEAVKIRRGIGATAKHQAPRSPKELIDPTGRRLVIVVSDCVSKVWREGKMTPILDLWAKRGSMAILQMLPEWMWKRSGLGWEALVRLQGLNPGDWNQNLKVDEFPLWWDEEVTHQVVKVPIFTLEPESVGSWARLVAGKGKVWAPGYLFKYAENQRPRHRPNSGGELTAEKRVNGFRATASRVARKLAGLLAAAPVITLPVVRLIQATLLKESLQVNVAEVFLGGLLKPISEIDIDTDPELVQYDFMPGVRELLLESVPVDETVRVIDEVSRRVAKNLGFAVEDFGAILRNPQQLGEGAVQENAIAFARVTAQILRSLGGAYIEYAEQLESPSRVEAQPTQTQEQETEENQQTALAQFWQQLLQAEMEGGTAAVHQVMRENMRLIVPDLGDMIAQSIPELLAQNPGQAEEITRLVENTCISIQEFPEGRYAEVLEITIRGYDVLLALGVDNPAKRAGTLMNLGNVCRTQAELGINPAANLERSITLYEEAAAILRQLGLDQDIFYTLTNLGNAYRTQAEMGINPAANLESAIAAYDEAAHILRRLGLDKDLSITLTNLGNAYRTQAEMGINPAANLERAIAAHDEAADILRRLGLDKDLSTTLTNLGNAYRTQANMGINPAENLERAIAAYDEAAAILRQLGLDKDLSITLTNLGVARLTQADMGINPAENLESAIAAHDEAADILRRLGLDKALSTTLTNLGNAYRTQANMGINPAENLERAIAAYDEAAHILRQLGLDKDLSITLTNLGVARLTQADMGINPAENLESAIAAHDEAADILRRLGLDKDLSTTLTNLGNACLTQANMGINPAENLERAIAAYDEAAGIQRELGLDKDLSITLTKLGNARLTQAEMGMDPGANLERAIAAYNEAAGIQRELGLDKDLSTTLNNLGNARRTQANMGIDPAANLDSAIAAYDEAAAIQRHLGLARDLAKTLNNLGLAYQAQSRLAGKSSTQKQQALENAYRSLQEALDRVEYLRGEIGADSEGYKRNFNEEWNKVDSGMVEVCLELGRYQDAIEYVDRSKARNLAELMANRDAYPGGVIPENVRQQLQSLKIAINQENRRLQQEKNPDYTRINQLRQQKQELEPYKPLHFEEMQGLLDEETAILEWYILPDKFLTFTLTAGSLNLWTSSQEDRNNLIHIDWTNTYLRDDLRDYHSNQDQWRNTLADRLETLSQILHLNEILSNLLQNFPNCKKLILIPHRHLHLFPLHALPTSSALSRFGVGGEGKFLQDLFPKGVGYAPNCQILQQVQNRSRPNFNRLFAIQNPNQNLHFTDMEVEVIQSLFNPHQVLKHDQAEKAAIDAETLKNAHCAHFSCGSYFNFENPLKSALILAKSKLTQPLTSEDQSRYIPLGNGHFLDLAKCLTLEDILNLDLSNCRLVTLSASETGITDFTSTSDEYIGLASGFLAAGSANVVGSLWSVNEVSTAILMIRFYETLHQQSKLSVAMALQQSQQWLRSATVQDLLDWVDGCPVISPERREQMKFTLQWGKTPESQPFESPFYWAAFVAIGL